MLPSPTARDCSCSSRLWTGVVDGGGCGGVGCSPTGVGCHSSSSSATVLLLGLWWTERGECLLIGGGAGVLGRRGWDVVVGVVRRVEVALFSGWFSCLGQHGDGTSRQTVVSLDRGSRRCHPVGLQLAELPIDGVELVRSQLLDFGGRLIRPGRHWWRKASLPKGGTCPAEYCLSGRPNIGRATTYQHPLGDAGQNLCSCARQLY